MILESNLRKISLLELNTYLMKDFEQRIYDKLHNEELRNQQLLDLLGKSDEEWQKMISSN